MAKSAPLKLIMSEADLNSYPQSSLAYGEGHSDITCFVCVHEMDLALLGRTQNIVEVF